MKTLLVPVAAALALATTAAIAQPSGSPESENQTATTKADEKNDRLVCRYVEANTGSRLAGRTRQCLTVDQWRAQTRR